MRAHTLLLITSLITTPGFATAQVKSKPDPKPDAKPAATPKFKYAEALARDVAAQLDGLQLKTSAEALAHDLAVIVDQVFVKDFKYDFNHIFDHDIDFDYDFDIDRDFNFDRRFGFESDAQVWPLRSQTWYQEDPADSLYRAAYAVFSRQQYRQAADHFAQVRAKFPNTRYFCDAAYYEAFSRYRLGTRSELRSANRTLDSMGSRCTSGARRADVPQLTARVNSALARLGDDEAAERVRRAASNGQNVCDTEERDVRIQALSALAQMDPATATPVLREVLVSKDQCAAPIRRQAIQLVARTNDQESVRLLGTIARTDPSRDNKLEAVRALGRMSNDAAYSALEQFFRTSADERVQVEAARSMARSSNPRAQATVRALVERNDVAERIRVSVIGVLASHPGTSVEYWRTLYSRLETDELRSAVVYAIGRSDSEEAQQFLLAIARNPQESYAAREAAISRIGATAPVGELYRMISTAETRSMRLSIVRILAGRREAEATDRLIDIAKSGTDPEVRRAAINALSQGHRKDDPRVIRALGEIVARGNP